MLGRGGERGEPNVTTPPSHAAPAIGFEYWAILQELWRNIYRRLYLLPTISCSSLLRKCLQRVPSWYSTGWMGWMSPRKWKETKQQPGTAGPGNILGCCLVSFRFLRDIHSIHSVKSTILCDESWPYKRAYRISNSNCGLYFILNLRVLWGSVLWLNCFLTKVVVVISIRNKSLNH